SLRLATVRIDERVEVVSDGLDHVTGGCLGQVALVCVLRALDNRSDPPVGALHASQHWIRDATRQLCATLLVALNHHGRRDENYHLRVPEVVRLLLALLRRRDQRSGDVERSRPRRARSDRSPRLHTLERKLEALVPGRALLLH